VAGAEVVCAAALGVPLGDEVATVLTGTSEFLVNA